jgi:hypothetical protein
MLLSAFALRKSLVAFATLALASAISLSPFALADDRDDDDSGGGHGDSNDFRIETLSTKPHLVSGGNVLVRIEVPKNIQLKQVRVELNGNDVTGMFRADTSQHGLISLVEGLRPGKNTLEASTSRHGDGWQSSQLTLTNYPINGPIISGPHEKPFICTTERFTLPDGTLLGAPLDANCSAMTRVHYVYRTNTTPSTFKPLPGTSQYPTDLAFTTTNAAKTVPYIVRVETGTINRAIYQTAILHDPLKEPTPSPFAAPSGWNRKLIYPLGGGCQGGWYTQGALELDFPGLGRISLLNIIDDAFLRKGYAVASSTLNIFANNCNDLLSSETVMMVKERFIEAYGLPLFTIGTGGSGGAYQSNQTADNYPGLFDGIVTSSTFPDPTTGFIVLADARLLDIYFSQTRPGVYTVEQQKAISGFSQVATITFLSRSGSTGAPRLDPVASFWLGGFPTALKYNPVTNPTGARATPYDHTVNVYGPFPDTGFARRPLDNVGVQYGLRALNDGVITVDQFLDLNQTIGGVDIDFKHIAQRTVADPGATRRAYKSGRILNTGGGLATTPIITRPGYDDANTGGGIHLKYWSFSIRDRLIRENGRADNQVIVGPGPVADDLFDQMDRWLTAILSDSSDRSKARKVVNNKPADLVDACWDASRNKIVEPQTPFGPGRCNQLYPTSLAPHLVAGAPIMSDVIKCQLKPIDVLDYRMTFSPAQLDRLHIIFPDGVCDWSRPGPQQVQAVTSASFGPSRVNLLFEVTQH